METDILKKFYEDERMRETVKAYVLNELKLLAIEQVFSKKATAGIYEAKKAIDTAFEKLESDFGRKEKTREPQTSR